MPSSILSDEAIVRELKAGTYSSDLLGELMQRYQDQIIRKCYHYVKDLETAKDVSQEVFIKVMLNIHDFDMKASFSTWLHRIIHNHCMDHLRKDKTKMHGKLSRYIVDAIEEELELEDARELPTIEGLYALMEEISEEEKQILFLKYKEGLSIKEIQQITHLPENTIKSHLHRAKKKLRDKLKRT